MNSIEITDQLVEKIAKLVEGGKTPTEVAQAMDLKRAQVLALLAYPSIKAEEAARKVDLSVSAAVDVAPPPHHEVLDVLVDEDAEEAAVSGIYLGVENDLDEPIYWTPRDSREVRNPHMMIMGESGSGKTYAIQCVSAELAQDNINSVVFDWGQSFDLKSSDPIFRNYAHPREYAVGEMGININPLEIYPGDILGPKQVAIRVSDTFSEVYNLGDLQRKVLIEAALETYQKSQITMKDKLSWGGPFPTLADLQETIENFAKDKEYPQRKNAESLSARLITFFMLNSLQVSDEEWSWKNLIEDTENNVHIFNFRGLDGKTLRIVVEFCLWNLFFYVKSRGPSPLQFYCILDEAHTLSFRDSGPIDRLLREGRKFGVGLILASQQPEDFSPVAYANCASKMVFQTNDPNLKVSKQLSTKCENFDRPEEIRDVIAVLRRGVTLFISKNRGHTVNVAPFQQRVPLWPTK